MSSRSGFRFLMGCGEPLRSRSWVALPSSAQSSLVQDNKPIQERAADRAVRRGGKSRL